MCKDHIICSHCWLNLLETLLLTWINFNSTNVLIWMGRQVFPNSVNYHDSMIHWGRVTHICIGKLTIIASDNGSAPGRHQAIIWTNAGILLIGPLGTKFNEISIEIHTFSFKKMHLKMSSAKWHPFCLGLNVISKQVKKKLVPIYWHLLSILHNTAVLHPSWCVILSMTRSVIKMVGWPN